MKKLKVTGTKEVLSEKKMQATSTSEAMDTDDMPQLISDDEEMDDQPTGKKVHIQTSTPQRKSCGK